MGDDVVGTGAMAGDDGGNSMNGTLAKRARRPYIHEHIHVYT